MRKTFLVLCIVALALLGLNMLPERTATADSDFVIGDLSKIAEKLRVVPEEDGKYSLASILEALHAGVVSAYSRAVILEIDTSNSVSELKAEMSSIKQGAVGVSTTQLNDLTDWTERELNRLWSNLRQLENDVRPGGGSYLESRIQWLESSMRQTERELNDLWNQLNNCCR